MQQVFSSGSHDVKLSREPAAGAGYFPNLDLLKYAAAICVIWIHLSALLKLDNPAWLEITIRTAVPFFFVTSGFLMGAHAAARPDFSGYFRSKGIQTLRLWVLWLLIYLPMDIIWSRHEEFSLLQVLRWIKHAVTTGEGTVSWPLWFLFSMFIGCFVLGLACRRKVVAGAVGVSVSATVLYIAANVLSLQPNIAERFLSGCIYMSAGILTSRYRPKGAGSGWLLAGSVLLLAAGCAMSFRGILLGTVPRSLGVVALAILLPQTRMPTKSIRQQSMWIFYTHMYCLGLLMLTPLRQDVQLYIVLGIVSSMLLGLALSLLAKIPKLRFLQTLISGQSNTGGHISS